MIIIEQTVREWEKCWKNVFEAFRGIDIWKCQRYDKMQIDIFEHS